MQSAGERLKDELLRLFARGADAPLEDAAFDELARRVFAHQYEHNAPYRRYCERRGATPEAVAHWSEVPAVPTAGFKETALVAGDAARAQRVFRTSGTTRGEERRGRHYVLDLRPYEASLLAGFRAFLMPDGARLRMLSLMPAARELPDSSLAHMISTVVEHLGAEGSATFASVTHGLDAAGLRAALHAATRAGEPVALLGTTLAFVHWLDDLERNGDRLRLPRGSRLMDTGGSKGASRELDPGGLRIRYQQALGIPDSHCVNEYGMTELSSQAYDVRLRRLTLPAAYPRGGDAVGELKAAVPWLRSRVVDPETLEPVARGRTGILQHYDLANVDSVLAVQTEDVARGEEHGFVLLGRAAGATPRGCSIAMDLLLEALGRVPR